ncbi:hypothetical protein Tco_0752378 [Tanacetum coccineum]|uniref:Gag-Pol polyprotein n=1 Tax=Tanacetum coccineum TaxID=301880 RepID=A0ABQ4Z9G4_9ASTR
MITNPSNKHEAILEPLSKMTEGNKKQYIADVKVMNYLLQAIPNDIYNSMDASKERELLESVYERLTTLVNIMDRNNVHPIPVSINTKFLNCLHPKWSKYVTMVRYNQTGDTVSYDVLYDTLVQFELDILASKAKKAAKNLDPLALLAHSNASSSQSHANSSYSPQPYYVTHPSSVVDYEDEYQGELQGDSQEDKLTTAMMLLARAITQKFSTPTNNRLRTSSNTRNQAVVQDGNGNDDSNQIVQRVPRTESTSRKVYVMCYNYNEKGHYACDYQKPRVCDAKYFRERMLLAMKDEVRSNLKDEENDFLLDNSYGEETMEELTAAVMLMARIQLANGNAETVPSYDAKAVSEVNVSSKVHEQVKNNGGISDHDSNAHDEYLEIQIYKAFKERENRYLEDIVDLEEKLSSHDRIIYKMGQSIQTIHILEKKPNKVYERFLKGGLGYKNPERLKNAIAAQPKMYDGERLHSAKLTIDSPDSEEILEDVEES